MTRITASLARANGSEKHLIHTREKKNLCFICVNLWPKLQSSLCSSDPLW